MDLGYHGQFLFQFLVAPSQEDDRLAELFEPVQKPGTEEIPYREL
jgi:hypothetical protein